MRILWLVLICSLTPLSVGCIKEKPQSYWEHNAARTIIHYMNIYDGLNPGVAKTNVAQIMTNIDNRPYPIELHRELLRFGKHAGFTNSFYEKYVFVPSGMTNLVKHGQPLLINSQPFPNRDGQMQRYVIYEIVWHGQPAYSYIPLPEDFVQKAFKQAGVTIPEPPRFPPAPPIPPPPPIPFNQKVHKYFRNLAVQIGMSSYHGRVLERIVAGLGVVSLVIVCSLVLRYARRRAKGR
jgi:hypothetical protein